MALQTPFRGTGEFVPEREWSCPVHERNIADYEEDDPWEVEGEVCLDCITGRWRDVRATDGTVVMREVGEMEYLVRTSMLERMEEMRTGLLDTLLVLRDPAEPVYHWMEDDRA